MSDADSVTHDRKLPPLVDVTRCPVCDSPRSTFAFGAQDLLHDVPGTYSYRRCLECASHFQAPRVADEALSQVYPGSYFTHERVAIADFTSNVLALGVRRLLLDSYSKRPSSTGRRLAGGLLRQVRPVRDRALAGLPAAVARWPDAERCLEIGPGQGEDLRRLAMLGWTVEGLDIDAAAAAHASAVAAAPVHVADLSTFDPGEKYDLVYSSHSLEHLPDLRGSIQRISAMLMPGGRLVAILPNGASLVTRIEGCYSVTLDPPRHLVLPSFEGLKAMIGEIGLRVVSAVTTSRRAAAYSAIARRRREGVLGPEAWAAEPDSRDSMTRLLEQLLVSVRVHCGEEILIVAEKARA